MCTLNADSEHVVNKDIPIFRFVSINIDKINVNLRDSHQATYKFHAFEDFSKKRILV